MFLYDLLSKRVTTAADREEFSDTLQVLLVKACVGRHM